MVTVIALGSAGRSASFRPSSSRTRTTSGFSSARSTSARVGIKVPHVDPGLPDLLRNVTAARLVS